MKKSRFIFFVLWICFSPIFGRAQPANNTPVLIGYYYGRTPCQELALQLKEPTTPECWKIKWMLTLFSNGGATNAGTFSMEGFKFRKENILKGTWQMEKGTKTDPNAMVYALKTAANGTIFLLKADEDVLLFLDSGKNILLGNKNFSYALYKGEKD